ncbi:SHOCT domain-containing protein [uncultured Pseudodesulfovibrio sp.]|uniref:SHOCT domain-containing protein n=1 Tax=uncultured Pseudodesulfovibrio sp. TaxID=2035858 RepID=UPI0029C68E0D|nr:SHOCT domain-containing protein [uncultured Pseudodesulfovibrio sp.]
MDYLTTYAHWCSGPEFGHGFMHGGGFGAMGTGFGFPVGGIVQLLILGLIIYFTVRLIRKPATHSGPGTPVDVLQRRYAAGEIDRETYRAMKDELRNS